MKNTITAIIIALFAFCGTVFGQTTQSDDSKAIVALMNQFGATWSGGDLKAFGDLLTDDVIHVSPFGDLTVGKTEVVKLMQWVHDVPNKGKKFEVTTSDETLNFTGTNSAVLTCRLKFRNDSAEKHPDERFTAVLAKVGKDWKVAQFQVVMISEPPMRMK
ncbi:MAG: nuclear transport factor 2 family protein [Acidobacteria bacterium]|nr:nuclear transport factor 2 family protein [Acidobacteriota bacterium]MBK8147171.1 nuclear transport factor 2 family protein [Acidobacteriota bacterium]MBK8810335.1 nuclear transport factor 2 family protein [Acidobacteriota bacterium]